jgi:hypothetical protein
MVNNSDLENINCFSLWDSWSCEKHCSVLLTKSTGSSDCVSGLANDRCFPHNIPEMILAHSTFEIWSVKEIHILHNDCEINFCWAGDNNEKKTVIESHGSHVRSRPSISCIVSTIHQHYCTIGAHSTQACRIQLFICVNRLIKDWFIGNGWNHRAQFGTRIVMFPWIDHLVKGWNWWLLECRHVAEKTKPKRSGVVRIENWLVLFIDTRFLGREGEKTKPKSDVNRWLSAVEGSELSEQISWREWGTESDKGHAYQ